MIKAGSLFYAIVISLIIAIVSGSLILFSFLTRIEFDKMEIMQQLRRNVDSGIHLLQATSAENEDRRTDLFGNGNDSVRLQRKHWGAFEILIAEASFKDQEAIRIVQAGQTNDSTKNYCLYLPDEDKPLALCGKTRITGTAYLPKAGLKRAYIEGQTFTGIRLLYGPSRPSAKTIPSFNKTLLTTIAEIFSQKGIALTDSIAAGQTASDSIFNSFRNNTLVYSESSTIKLSDGIYSGNIAFISGTQINISATALLKDVILAAPRIIIEKGFKGNFQAFATDSIILQEEVTLEYPSVLGIVKKTGSSNACIVISGKDSVCGSIFSCKDEKDVLKQTGILIKKDSFVHGEVYTNGYADIQGTVHGSVTCTKIMLSTPSSVYENHLLNAVIDATKRSAYFAGIQQESEANKTIVKYLE